MAIRLLPVSDVQTAQVQQASAALQAPVCVMLLHLALQEARAPYVKGTASVLVKA